MAILLLFLGAVLIGLTWKKAWRQAIDEEKHTNSMESIAGLDQRVSALEAKVSQLELSPQAAVPEGEEAKESNLKWELLLRAITGLENKMDTFSKDQVENNAENNGEKDFSAYIKEASHQADFKEIFEAYLSGMTVTEIAQKFGKGKGEVELILNLQKSNS